ncbi:MAG: alkaline phosphatase family protein [Nocardioides sp.]
MRRTTLGVTLSLAAALLLAGCGGSQDSSGPTAASVSAQGFPGQGASMAPVTKLLVVIGENHSFSQMKDEMPYTFGLAESYGYATAYYALAHPSLPNYLVIAGGSTFGVVDDDDPSAHPVSGPSVFGRALANGGTAAVFNDAMTTPCQRDNDGTYAVRHNPWTYFVDEASQCETYDLPMSAFDEAVATGRLPTAGMVVPDLVHDAHDAPLSGTDVWFHALMDKVFAGPDWASGHLAVVLTADEDEGSDNNRVLTVVIHPSQSHHVVSTRLDHYSLSRLYAEVEHAAPLGQAGDATSMADAFGLPVD